MWWYDTSRPPFGPGEKRKEFPDAFTFVIIREYARRTSDRVAVVSLDDDLRRACERESALHHFPSLDALTEALLRSGERFNAACDMAKNSISEIARLVRAEFHDRGFEHEHDPNGRGYVDQVEVTDVEIDPEEITIIGLGHREFTFTFGAKVSFNAHVEYDDPDSWVSGDPGDDVFYLHQCKGIVSEEVEISGVARVTTNETWAEPGAITSFHIDQDNIVISAEAEQSDEPDDMGDEPEPVV